MSTRTMRTLSVPSAKLSKSWLAKPSQVRASLAEAVILVHCSGALALVQASESREVETLSPGQ